MILIVSNTQDLTCDFVVRELGRRRGEFFRLNLDEFPRFASGKVTVGAGLRQEAELRWTNRGRILHFSDVRSVLYRRPVSPVPDEAISDDALRKFCSDESYDFVRGILYSLDCHWISHPDAIRRAEHKVYQLKIAAEVGLPIPKTLISNDPCEVLKFFDECSGQMVAKCLYMGFIEGEEPLLIFTSKVGAQDLAEIDSVRFAPSIYQQHIDKLFDLRVTVVGARMFSAKIESTSGMLDWRASKREHLRHSPYALPNSIADSCLDLVRRLGLDFGAIDLVVDRRGEIFFLEINPNGQWAWLETILEFPISAAIVDRLQGGGL